jgi:Fe-Mn family superoxide dismutase
MHILPELPFDKKAFGSYISEEGFDYHHGKHHNAYVTNLNNLIKDTAMADLSLEEVINKSASEKNIGVFNNSAQHYNHSFFWNCLSPNGGGAPSGEIAERINRDFGSFENFKEQFSTSAVKLFGSGWVWLVSDESGKLSIKPFANADTPLVSDASPILTLDVWEHAYYIDHRNARPKFVEGFWDIVNWDFANKNL